MLQVTPEADFSGEVYIFDYVSLTQEGICLAEVNGVYQHELEASGTYVLVLGDTEEFTAKIEVPGEVLSTAVEGQTTATLKNHKAGSYACVVTLKDGTKLVSETVELTDADITHTYDDEYDADCNGCGATREVPERPDNSDTDENQNGDNISNKGDAQMNLFCVMGFVLLGVGLLGLKKNKYIQ